MFLIASKILMLVNKLKFFEKLINHRTFNIKVRCLNLNSKNSFSILLNQDFQNNSKYLIRS